MQPSKTRFALSVRQGLVTMSFMSFFRSKPTARRPPSLAELSVVALAHDIDAGGRTLPKGTRGTVVHNYRGGKAVEVEFDHPFHAVLTLVPSDLTP